MTVDELLSLVAKRWKRMLVIVLVACVAGVAFGAFKALRNTDASKPVTATVVSNGSWELVNGLASSEADEFMKESPDITIEVKPGQGDATVAITVSGGPTKECAEAANYIAHYAVDTATELLEYNEGAYEATIPYRGNVIEAEEDDTATADSTSMLGVFKKMIKFGMAGFIGGVLLSICWLMCEAAIRHPIRSVHNVSEETHLPVLDVLPASDGGEKLLANIQFASAEEAVQTLCVIPIGESESAQLVVKTISVAVKSKKRPSAITKTICCDPLTEGIEAAYKARSADATIIAVKVWEDSMPELLRTIKELELASSNTIGIVALK